MSRTAWRYVVVAALALAVGAAGTAGAARLITGKQIANGSIGLKDISKKARKALKGARGPEGPRGPQGAAGINGAPGAPGTSGSTAPALLMGTMGASNATSYSTPTGGNFGSLAGAEVPVPPGTQLTARDFNVHVSAPPGGMTAFNFALMLNGSPTALACTIAGAATSCQPPDPSVTLPLPAGGKIAIRQQPTGSPGNATAGFSMRVVF